MNDNGPISCSSCTFEYIESQLLVQRFFPTARFTKDVMDEASAIRDRLCEETPSGLIVIIPGEVPVSPSATNNDHFLSERTQQRILALAVVAEGTMMHSVSKFYFNWFPQPFPVEVFSEEAEAMEWMKKQLAGNLSAAASS